jgi:tetratricopeptide (TPR) repeat protein
MDWTRKQPWPALAVVLVLTLVGCTGGPKEDPLDTEWASIQEAKASLDAKRQQLAEFEAEAEAAAAAPAEEATEGEAAAEGDEAAAPTVDRTAEIEALRQEIPTLADDLGARIVAFLNQDQVVANEGPTERQLAAIRLKSAEDMLVAQEWIDEGGDYRQAINIYENALRLDPDNTTLKAALASATENRYMSEDRFATVSKGMTDDDVRAALGRPLHHNVKTYEDKGVTAWFYPTAEDGAAAAVWFRPDDAGEMVCYLVKYDAVPGRGDA